MLAFLKIYRVGVDALWLQHARGESVTSIGCCKRRGMQYAWSDARNPISALVREVVEGELRAPSATSMESLLRVCWYLHRRVCGDTHGDAVANAREGASDAGRVSTPASDDAKAGAEVDPQAGAEGGTEAGTPHDDQGAADEVRARHSRTAHARVTAVWIASGGRKCWC